MVKLNNFLLFHFLVYLITHLWICFQVALWLIQWFHILEVRRGGAGSGCKVILLFLLYNWKDFFLSESLCGIYTLNNLVISYTTKSTSLEIHALHNNYGTSNHFYIHTLKTIYFTEKVLPILLSNFNHKWNTNKF